MIKDMVDESTTQIYSFRRLARWWKMLVGEHLNCPGPLSRRFFSQHPVTFRYYLVSSTFNSIAAVQPLTPPQLQTRSALTQFQRPFPIEDGGSLSNTLYKW